mmetsp:Transcript_43782/g.70372  ORF Transcript_43782/g.70372 Transcript_43782/m.70372 type:complete len:125 (-) Transcript_43782:565-939(-)
MWKSILQTFGELGNYFILGVGVAIVATMAGYLIVGMWLRWLLGYGEFLPGHDPGQPLLFLGLLASPICGVVSVLAKLILNTGGIPIMLNCFIFIVLMGASAFVTTTHRTGPNQRVHEQIPLIAS